jgi:hypothetical protein
MFRAVLYEALAILLNTMITLYDTHTHVPPVGGPPSVPMYTTVFPLLTNVASKKVLMGG